MEKRFRIFIGSSSETESMMRSLGTELSDRGFMPVPWQGSFILAQNTLSELWRLAHEVDFAVFIWSAESMLEDRGRQQWAPRDNVIYEAGLFAGVLSPNRVFLVIEAGPDVKIPSDYLGVGYASYKTSDGDCVSHAAAEIQKAIAHVRKEMSMEDLTLEIEGLWVDAVVNFDEMSVISTFELRRRGAAVLDIVNGRSWDPDGEPRAHFKSTSSRFDAGANTLTYSWQGKHPREPGASEYFGVGTLEFDPACLSRARGEFSVSPRAALGETKLFTRICRKPAMSDARGLLADDPETRKEAVKRLLQWRGNVR